jgi:nucleoside 2-deoxyribosyltransferase
MNVKKKVYLAGPISGLSHAECIAWRSIASTKLEAAGITAFSPMRHKEFLSDVGKIEQSYPQHALSSDRAIMTRDHNDVLSSDAILVNLLDSPRVTIGTVMELAWAWDRRIPVVVVMEEKGNIHDHPMVREAIGFRVKTLEEGIACVLSVLNHN